MPKAKQKEELVELKVRLPLRIKAQLEALAENNGRSTNKETIQAINQWIDGQKKVSR